MLRGLIFGILGAGALGGGAYLLYEHAHKGGAVKPTQLAAQPQPVPQPASDATTLAKLQGTLGSIAGTATNLAGVIGGVSSAVTDLGSIFS